MPKQCFGVILGPHYEFFNRLGHERYTDPSLKSGVMKDAFELGQPSLPGCDVIGLRTQPPEDAAGVLGHSFSLFSFLLDFI